VTGPDAESAELGVRRPRRSSLSAVGAAAACDGAPSARTVGIDVARAVAMLGMAITHYGGRLPGHMRPNQIISFWDGRAMPLFLVVSGYAMSRFVTARNRTGAEVAGRGAALLLLGLLLEHQVGALVILQFYALYYAGAWALRRASAGALVGVGVLVALAGAGLNVYALAWLESVSGAVPPAPDHAGELGLLLHPITLALQLTVLGAYPLLPSFSFVAIGMVLARARRLDASRVIVAGLAVLACSAAVTSAAQAIHPEPRGYVRDASGKPHLTAERVRQLSSQARVSPDAFLRSRLGPHPDEQDVIALAALPDGPWRSPWRLVSAGRHSQMLGWVAEATGIALLIVGVCVALGRRMGRLWRALSAAGTCSLTFYIAHLLLINLYWNGFRDWGMHPGDGVLKAVATFCSFVVAAALWRRRHRRGPLEAVVARVGVAAVQTAGVVRRAVSQPRELQRRSTNTRA
jgi:uncharacterized membrane protein YeiB